MRTIRILACLAAVFAVSAVAAGSAAASPEFDAEQYPVRLEGIQLNNHGFGDPEGKFAAVCEHATLKTEEEAIQNPTSSKPTLTVHPRYGLSPKPTKCVLTLRGAVTGEAVVNTEGCKYVFHAVPPNKLEGTTDVVCGKQLLVTTPGNCKITGKENEPCEIKLEPQFQTGCVISLPAQTGLKNVEYKNEPAGEVKLAAEVKGITTKITSGCELGITTASSEYREGVLEVKEGKEFAKLAPSGRPAVFQLKGKVPVGGTADPIEVGTNEPHWYQNHARLAAQSGGPGEEGVEVLGWGKVTFAATEVGTTVCETLWHAYVYNPGGGGFGSGNAVPGEAKIDAFHPVHCEEKAGELCEITHLEKLTVEPEALDKFGEWEAQLTAPPPVRLKIGNRTGGSPTQIKLNVVCGNGVNYTAKWTGELLPSVEPGSAIGSSPAKLQFNAGSLEAARSLPTVGTEVGNVTNNVKFMGFEGGEILSTKNP
jgi:hypothetical protein